MNEKFGNLTTTPPNFMDRFKVLEDHILYSKGGDIRLENQKEIPDLAHNLPAGFAIADLPKFTGTEDPLYHVRKVRSQLALKGVTKELYHLLLPQTFGDAPLKWFYKLHSTRTNSWDALTEEFYGTMPITAKDPSPSERSRPYLSSRMKASLTTPKDGGQFNQCSHGRSPR